MVVNTIALGLPALSLAIWIGLLCFRGQFWQADQRLSSNLSELETWPSVCAVIPARNEADLLPITLRSLLVQDYPGSFTVILVDDQSTDGTADIARQVAHELGKSSQLSVCSTSPLPPGWSGKLWALEQGVRQAHSTGEVTSSRQPPDYLLLTDADIEHDVTSLRRLIVKAKQDDLDLVSLMVLLRCQGFWEKFLIPAFVFFFQKVYPFRWVNDSTNSTAAAAGGCSLVYREALTRIGGIEAVRQALIDDCALAQAIKSTGQQIQPKARGRIWLGLTSSIHSLRPYSSLATIWEMVARTAFTQLNYSLLLLLGALAGMTLVYIVPPVAAILGGLTGSWLVAATGLCGWLLMSWAYLPTLQLYRCSPAWAFSLPAIAFLYTLMTLDSALRHWRGQGGAWKGRVYPATDSRQL